MEVKKLTIAEKAKRYDEVIPQLKGLLDGIHEEKCDIMEEDILKIFPELKESKDERIRKWLIYYFKEVCNNVSEKEKKGVLAWLEKQGEKPSKKAEPKFKVGDWIVTPANKVFQITSIEGTSYKFDNESHYWEICYCDEQCRLWTIQDAKDGDILLSPSTPEGDKECPFIFKEIDKSGIVRFHAALLQSRELKIDDGITNVMGYANAGYHVPATKEQRDLFFQKMREAGYEWDAEKKELKKIEKKCGDWSEEDENRFRNLIYLVEHSNEGKGTKEGFVKFINRLKSLRLWLISITDEELAQAKKDAYNNALDKIEYHSGEPTFDDGWSAAIWYLKNKNVQPQSTWKPSDEQIKTLEFVIESLDDMLRAIGHIDNFTKPRLKEVLAALKKLREE